MRVLYCTYINEVCVVVGSNLPSGQEDRGQVEDTAAVCEAGPGGHHEDRVRRRDLPRTLQTLPTDG